MAARLLAGHDNYSDLAKAERFESLFGGLAVGHRPTGLHHNYLVRRFDFAAIETSQEVAELRRSFSQRIHYHVRRTINRYPSSLGGDDLARETDAQAAVEKLLIRAESAGVKLYVLIDEDDNFANDLLARDDSAVFREMVHAGGFVRTFYKVLKGRGRNRSSTVFS